MGTAAPTTSVAALADPADEGVRLVRLADERGLTVRLLGGVAFRMLLPDWTDGGRAKNGAMGDIDVATRQADARELAALLATAGYQPDAHYNALYGYKQLYFVDPVHQRPLDVLVGALEMCHRFEFGERLAIDQFTLPLAELLLSKLQVVELNRKDAADALGLLSHFPLTDHDGGAINVGRIVAITSRDWGWWRTVSGNLLRLRQVVADDPDLATQAQRGPFDPVSQIATLDEAIQSSRKSRRWRARALIGERIRWYDQPDEMTH